MKELAIGVIVLLLIVGTSSCTTLKKVKESCKYDKVTKTLTCDFDK